jgi:hypothetical protein
VKRRESALDQAQTRRCDAMRCASCCNCCGDLAQKYGESRQGRSEPWSMPLSRARKRRKVPYFCVSVVESPWSMT